MGKEKRAPSPPHYSTLCERPRRRLCQVRRSWLQFLRHEACRVQGTLYCHDQIFGPGRSNETARIHETKTIMATYIFAGAITFSRKSRSLSSLHQRTAYTRHLLHFDENGKSPGGYVGKFIRKEHRYECFHHHSFSVVLSIRVASGSVVKVIF